MTGQFIAVFAFAIVVLVARERMLYQEHKTHSHDRLAEDAEVARLEEWFDLEWTDTH